MSSEQNKIMNEPFVMECINSIRKSYGYYNEIPQVIIEEIKIMYPRSGGCWFMDWLNHRLYAEIIANSCLVTDADVKDYIHFEDLEEEEEEDEDEKDLNEKQKAILKQIKKDLNYR